MKPLRAPVGGRTFDGLTVGLLVLFAFGLAMIAWRFAAGIGPVSGLDDGHPWGIWIAFDVVTGTALACGGYGVALLVFVFNRWSYHPLVRPAILTSALGYSIAGLSLIVDTGRPWNFYKVPISFGDWNFDSALLEVALCIMAYTAVAWLKVAPGVLEGLAKGRRPGLAAFATKAHRWIERGLPVLLGLGFLLPTLHQSSLGGLMVLTGTKLHPLWQTPLLPLLFLASCLSMGFAAVVLESTLAHAWFRRKRETALLAQLAAPTAFLLLLFAGARIADVAVRGQLAEALRLGSYGGLFLAELLLAVLPALWLLRRRGRADHAHLFRMAMLVILGSMLYRFDAFIVAFDPGPGWAYFPTVPEILITLGLVALEIVLYVLFVKRFPILGGVTPREAGTRSPS
jgi:Ni/Fe-hydrogenase subunit HybB-like protein